MRRITIADVEYIGIVEVYDNRFIVWFPDVPGASVGIDQFEAIPERAAAALYLRFAWLEKHSRQIPKARELVDLVADPVVKLSMIKGVDFVISVRVRVKTEVNKTVVSFAA